jgi:hypothetical protein
MARYTRSVARASLAGFLLSLVAGAGAILSSDAPIRVTLRIEVCGAHSQ